MRTPNRRVLTEVDANWPDQRRADDQHLAWVWADICAQTAENFVLVDAAGRAAGIWACKRAGLITLDGASFYRLDRFEIAPQYRGAKVYAGETLAVLLFSVVAARAEELSAAGVVLGALPASVAFYAGLGGEERLVCGWTVESGLIPFVFTSAQLVELRKDIDELVT